MSLNQHADRNRVSLEWMPGNMGLMGMSSQMHWCKLHPGGARPEPTCGIAPTTARRLLTEWTKRRYLRHWRSVVNSEAHSPWVM